jgi:kynureninase
VIAVARAHRVPVASPLDADRRGGSVMLELPPGVDAAGAVTVLARHGLIADHRGQRLRLSPGPCTTDAAIERLDRALGEALRA